MSTRARTRTAAAAPKTPTAKTASKAKPQTKAKRTEDTENEKPAKSAAKTKSKPAAKATTPPVYCLCRKGDDGSPMVNCGECNEWYHFGCVDLSEETAEDINVYICQSCTDKTGQHTVMLWEGPEAVEDRTTTISEKTAPVPEPGPVPELEPHAHSDSDPSSEDEYVADSLKAKGASSKRRRARRLSFSSESGSESEAEDAPGTSKKRKAQKAPHPPPSKRKKAADASDAKGDPARTFCLGKLEGVFRDIFLRYPHVGGVEKKAEELTEGERAAVEEESKQFATDLEQCVYDIYSEPDKQGRASAGGKYKDRFRMLQFNLSKDDRVVLHKRIASGNITAKEISLMSSTDLANEETKQSIKIAEKEALEHSILEKTVIPRAKLTHKGLQDIEDLDSDVSNLREREIERQRAEEEKRERERAARLRTQRQRTASVSVPPESPLTPVGANWGAPPPVPMHSLTPTQEMGGAFADGTSLLEQEMNLADLINIDEVQDSAAPAPAASPTVLVPTQSSSSSALPVSSPTHPTGISPFASIKPEAPRTSSFDLNSLWAPKKDKSPSPIAASPPPQPQSPAPIEEEQQERKDVLMDLDETDDQDFDMFLEEKDTDKTAPTPEALQAAFDAVPKVWSGKINMPLDSTIPQETPVFARQIGGRTLESGSPLWRTLFPSELLRIDGRVPVDKSAHFLLQTRMNSTKELIAVAFTPESQSGSVGFQILTDFLIAKGRHGLVFPWGPRPKDFHPGKELYIIPLLSSDSVPDYMELLDNLHLPRIRSSNYLIGIWVLNKGKLTSPPPPPPPTAPAPVSVPVSVPVAPSFNVPSQPPAAVPGMTPIPPLSFEPSVLAAEVAALTPEQVRMMLQTLTASTLNSLPAAGALPLPQAPIPPPQPQPHAWGHPPIPGPSMGYPPPQMHQPPQQHGPPYGPPPPHQQLPYDRRDYNRDPYPPGPGYDRGGRGDDRGGRDGWNSRGGGRGRGRGRGGGDSTARPLDSGWPRRRDSNGPSSPTQRRWN